MDIKFAIFDMDGTLVDSMGYWNRLADEYLARHGIPPLSPELKEESIALTMQGTGELFIREFGLPGTADDIAREVNALMEEHYRTDVSLKPGAAALLERMRAAGFKMCVASSTAPALLDICLRRLGVRDYFQFLLSCEEVGVGKNHPDVYLEADRRLGGTPENTVIFEDILVAAQTAKKAGFSLGVIYDVNSHTEQPQLKTLADCYVTRWDDPALPKWLGV
ncbi:HAD family hydrolase [Flintibacter muris]|uniref:HAD family hydrolase n=1 Tax=Flintibacter muris TaxID=2941327 RepID=UPI00203A760F|nr:HAD family phosphatase [Flintibacter muris]